MNKVVSDVDILKSTFKFRVELTGSGEATGLEVAPSISDDLNITP